MYCHLFMACSVYCMPIILSTANYEDIVFILANIVKCFVGLSLGCSLVTNCACLFYTLINFDEIFLYNNSTE